GGVDSRKEFNLGRKAPVAVAQKSKTSAAGKRAHRQTKPGDDAHPVNFTLYGGQENENQGQNTGQWQRQVESPANSGGVANEHVGKPYRYGRRTGEHKITQGQEIANQRQVTGTKTEKAFDLREDESREQEGDEQRGGKV